jgi:hypothetical protein
MGYICPSRVCLFAAFSPVLVGVETTDDAQSVASQVAQEIRPKLLEWWCCSIGLALIPWHLFDAPACCISSAAIIGEHDET